MQNAVLSQQVIVILTMLKPYNKALAARVIQHVGERFKESDWITVKLSLAYVLLGFPFTRLQSLCPSLSLFCINEAAIFMCPV